MFYLRCSIGIKRNKEKMLFFFLFKILKWEKDEARRKICVVACDFSHSNYEVIPFPFISTRKQLNVQSLKKNLRFLLPNECKVQCRTLNMVIAADAHIQIRICCEASS